VPLDRLFALLARGDPAKDLEIVISSTPRVTSRAKDRRDVAVYHVVKVVLKRLRNGAVEVVEATKPRVLVWTTSFILAVLATRRITSSSGRYGGA
jgi:hypothetical protein